jgi:hypothetical protein
MCTAACPAANGRRFCRPWPACVSDHRDGRRRVVRSITSTRAPDGLLLRRARLVFDAARADGWRLHLQPDFGQGRVQVQDAFVGYQRPGLTARAGRCRPAFGTVRMQSSATLLSPERGPGKPCNSTRAGAVLGVERNRSLPSHRTESRSEIPVPPYVLSMCRVASHLPRAARRHACSRRAGA